MGDLHPCRNPSCSRLVSALSYFCCAPCNDADYGKYEIDAHSTGCDERHAERNKASNNDTGLAPCGLPDCEHSGSNARSGEAQ